MSFETKTIQWFAELESEVNALTFNLQGTYSAPKTEASSWQKWANRAQSAIESTFGSTSPQAENFAAAYKKCSGFDFQVAALKGIFFACKADLDGGYIFSAEKTISGELLGDFVVMAKMALDEGHKDVAAVLACAALEDTLKRYARLNDLTVDQQVMQKVVNALKAKGLVTGAQKSLLDSMPKIRDYAMHANWDKITPQDVGSVIGFVEQFLLHNF